MVDKSLRSTLSCVCCVEAWYAPTCLVMLSSAYVFGRFHRISNADYWFCHVSVFHPSVCLPFRLEQLCSHWTDFYKTWYLSICSNFCWQVWSLIQIRQEWRVLYMDRCTFVVSRSVILIVISVSDKICTRETQNPHRMLSNVFFYLFRKSYLCWGKVEKCRRASQTMDDNITRRVLFCLLHN
jgi:hypothetical protein